MLNSESDDQIPWTDFVTELSPSLLGYFLALFPRQTAADLVQETLLRLVQQVRSRKFDQSKGTLRMYAYGIARLVRMESRRKEMAIDAEFDLEALPAPTNDWVDERQRVRWAISQLKPIEQDVVLLLLDKDLSLAEIADNLNIPLGTVKSHMHRAKAAIKELLKAATKAGET